jgi:hypothetical protein
MSFAVLSHEYFLDLAYPFSPINFAKFGLLNALLNAFFNS